MKHIQVSVTQGTLVGCEDTLPNGKPYYSFQGIPYALPPIGELRFKVYDLKFHDKERIYYFIIFL